MEALVLVVSASGVRQMSQGLPSGPLGPRDHRRPLRPPRRPGPEARYARRGPAHQVTCVRARRSGIRPRTGLAQDPKAPPGQLRAILAELPEGFVGVRDRVLLLVGFAGAPRRSELVALKVRGVEWVEDGLKLTLTRSKADQEGA